MMAPQQGAPAMSLGRALGELTRPWAGHLAVVGALVIAAAILQLVPPLVVRSIVDNNLAVGSSDGLLALAIVYLLATAAAQAFTFGYTYLAARVAQAVLNTLRVGLFAHYQRLPASYFDRTPIG